jgi:hypothetical protein
MITEKYYSDITNKYYDFDFEAENAEMAWAKAVMREHGSKGYIATDNMFNRTTALNPKVDARTLLNAEMFVFVPLNEDVAKAFLVLADYDGDELFFEPNEFSVRTPIKYEDNCGGWVLIPDLVKHVHRIYTELSDEMAKVENDINETTGEG